MLSFASLSVRPGLYALFEEQIVRLPSPTLRPALKSLILGLLPAIEEETSEDFDRAYAIVESLEHRFTELATEQDSVHSSAGYFWQCLFLCVITNASRRQGALNYMTRRLPRFAQQSLVRNGNSEELSPEAEAVTTPEPGLLVRCFIAGLSDPQILIQRGFLDLLVTHLPLHSPVLQGKVESRDLDRLVSAAVSVLLRRDMSLNRRLWSWFLGPEPKDGATAAQSPSPTLQRAASPGASMQVRYFEAFGRAPIERCALAMFATKSPIPAERARPFRICLSLMDRWEIGSALVPRIFLPALESTYKYSLTASANDLVEVLRSAGLFFDGVEANLIWARLIGLLRHAFEEADAASNRLRLFEWVLDNFNVRDEEMTTIHIPLTAVFMLGLLNSQDIAEGNVPRQESAVRALSKLLQMMPARAFEQSGKASQAHALPDIANMDICRKVAEFYDEPPQNSANISVPFNSGLLSYLLLDRAAILTTQALQSGQDQLFCVSVTMSIILYSKVPGKLMQGVDHVQQAVETALIAASDAGARMPFPTIASIVALFVMLRSEGRMIPENLLRLEPALTDQLWYQLSPALPKYHVEAVKSLWQLEDLMTTKDTLKVSLLTFMRFTPDGPASIGHAREEAVRRFTILWNHTVSSQATGATAGAYGPSRRGSAVPSASDAAQTARRISILSEPLLLVLDVLREPSAAASQVVKNWLSGLPSLDQVLSILLRRMNELQDDGFHREPDSNAQGRWRDQHVRDTVSALDLLQAVLGTGNRSTWDCLAAFNTRELGADDESGPMFLARACVRLLSTAQTPSTELDEGVLSLLELLIASPVADELKALDLESSLIDRLIASLSDGKHALQGLLLQLVTDAIKLRLSSVPRERPSSEYHLGGSVGTKGSSMIAARPNGSISGSTDAPTPPTRLLHCIRAGFTSPSARLHLDQWLSFLASILPTFAGAIFAGLIPLVECLCAELDKTFQELFALTKAGPVETSIAPDTVIVGLLEALELILARAHDSLFYQSTPETASKPPTQPNSFLGSVAAGVFRAEGPPSKTAQANSRLTIILAFHDSIRTCLRIWTWSSRFTEADDFDNTSAATTAYSALRLRSKTRYLLEQMFSVEPLESLEVVMARWRFATGQSEAAAVLSLLQVMQGSRPKNIIPAILDALCSRTNPAALPPARHSSQTLDLTATDVALFLLAYLEATEDDAMDEVWADCIAFLRDVLANPLPYRQILPPFLELVHLLAKKVGNTNFGEQRKMRRELGDIFQRLLAATFTTLPSGFIAESTADDTQKFGLPAAGSFRSVGATDLMEVLRGAVIDLDAILETPERVTAAINNITSSIISPVFRAKSFPMNISLKILTLLVAMARKAPHAKPWKKELSDVFNDARLMTSPSSLVEAGWLPALRQWCLQDKDRMADMLSRLTPPSSAGIMFGVGASAARQEADRRTQLNLRRICLLLLASPEDTWVAHLRDFDEKLVELSGAIPSSSPSSAIKAELFMLCMALVLSLSATNLSPLWPSLNGLLQAALTSLGSNSSTDHPFGNLSLFQACKLLDQLVALSPDEFQLHEWLYIVDTVDAVYQPDEWTPAALADHVAEVIGSGGAEDSQTLVPSTATANPRSGQRALMLNSDVMVDKEDAKALPRDEFARSVLRPFLSQLSIHAYEGVYSMELPNAEACRRRLLEDVLDLSTIVE